MAEEVLLDKPTPYSLALSVSAHLLCVGGVKIASDYALRRWIAVSSLTPPEHPEEKAEEVEVASSKPPLKGWRLRLRQGCVFVLAMLPFALFQIVINVIIPKIKIQGVVDSLYFLMLFGIMWVSFDGTIRILKPIETVVNYTTAKIPTTSGEIKRGWKTKIDTPQPRHKLFWTVPLMAVSLSTLGLYNGLTIVTPILAGCWVIAMSAGFSGPKLSMKWLIMIFNGYLASIPVIVLVVGLIATLFGKGDTDFQTTPSADGNGNGQDKDANLLPAVWILQGMMSMLYALATTFPSWMLCMAMRYDHSNSISLHPKSAPGEGVTVPPSTPSFAKPTFNAGMTGLIVSLGGYTAVKAYYCIPDAGELGALVITIPVVTLSMIFSAWIRGNLSSFWRYSEVWVPAPEEPTKATSDDLESANTANDEVLDAEETEKLLLKE